MFTNILTIIEIDLKNIFEDKFMSEENTTTETYRVIRAVYGEFSDNGDPCALMMLKSSRNGASRKYILTPYNSQNIMGTQWNNLPENGKDLEGLEFESRSTELFS